MRVGGGGGGGGGGGLGCLRLYYEQSTSVLKKHWLVFLKLLNFKSDLFQSRTTLFYKFGECQCHC